MDGVDMQRWAWERADELPGARAEQPFGPDWDVAKVRGKVFMLTTIHGSEPLLTLKADPDDGRALREQYQQISLGYHMNKRHWITVHPGEDVSRELVEELVTESYLLVVAGLPRARCPLGAAALRSEYADQLRDDAEAIRRGDLDTVPSEGLADEFFS